MVCDLLLLVLLNLLELLLAIQLFAILLKMRI